MTAVWKVTFRILSTLGKARLMYLVNIHHQLSCTVFEKEHTICDDVYFVPFCSSVRFVTGREQMCSFSSQAACKVVLCQHFGKLIVVQSMSNNNLYASNIVFFQHVVSLMCSESGTIVHCTILFLYCPYQHPGSSNGIWKPYPSVLQ